MVLPWALALLLSGGLHALAQPQGPAQAQPRAEAQAQAQAEPQAEAQARAETPTPTSVPTATLPATLDEARPLPCEDDALAEAASELLLRQSEPSGADLTLAAHRAGSDAPAIHALSIRDGDEARIAPFLDRLRERLHAPVVCGLGRTEDRVLVLAAARGGSLTIDAESERAEIALAPGFRDPIVFVEDASGAVARLVPARDGRVELPPDAPRPLRVQLVARGADGPRPVAERAVGGTLRSGGRGGEAPLDERIDRLRAGQGASALRPHRLLASLAADHAAAVCRAGRAAHELVPGRDPRARLRDRSLEAREVGEVIARGADAAEAFETLVRSPSHRSALLDGAFTDAGAGLSTDARGRTCLVVLLAAWPRLVIR